MFEKFYLLDSSSSYEEAFMFASCAIQDQIESVQCSFDLKINCHEFHDDKLNCMKIELKNLRENRIELDFYALEGEIILMNQLELANIINENSKTLGVSFAFVFRNKNNEIDNLKNHFKNKELIIISKKSKKIGELLGEVSERFLSKEGGKVFKKYANHVVYEENLKKYNSMLSYENINEIEGFDIDILDTRKLIILEELGILDRIKELNDFQHYSDVGYAVAKLLNINKEHSARIVGSIKYNKGSKNNPYETKRNKDFIKQLRDLLN